MHDTVQHDACTKARLVCGFCSDGLMYRSQPLTAIQPQFTARVLITQGSLTPRPDTEHRRIGHAQTPGQRRLL